MVYLSDCFRSRDNNFNLIRMVAASGVLVSHAWPLSLGRGVDEPLELMTGYSLGKISVFVFFAISGFLIAKSYERQPTLFTWGRARVLRLFPALAVVLVLTAFVLGPLVTDLPVPTYFNQPETFLYVLRNLSLAFLQFDLPGVFLTNPFDGSLNGSLWTLFYEVVCYGGVLVAGLLGALRHKWLMAALLSGFFALYMLVNLPQFAADVPFRLQRLMFLGLPFAMGTAFYVWRDRLALHPAVAVALIAVTVLLPQEGLLYEPVFMLAMAYTVFVLGYLPKGTVLNYNRLGDYSYGMYIYAFPTQQLMVHLFGPMAPVTNILLAFPVTLACAILSWNLIESPALSFARTGARSVTDLVGVGAVTRAER